MIKKIEVTKENSTKCIKELKEILMQLHIKGEYAAKAIVTAEVILAALFEKSTDGIVTIKVLHTVVGTNIRFISKGEAIKKGDISKYLYEMDDTEFNIEIQQLIERTAEANISHRYKDGVNFLTVKVIKSDYASLIWTLFALLAGALFGILVKFVFGQDVSNTLSECIFEPISDMFLSAIKMIVGPLIFFSMAVSICDFNNLKSLGRIVAKVTIGYVITSLIAIGVGIFVYQIFPIGDTSLAAAVTDAAASYIETSEQTTISIIDTIVNIIPNSFLGPFTTNNMLQLIFIGIITGIGVGKVSGKYGKAKDSLNCMNDIFSEIITIVIGFLPLSVFCCMAKMTISIKLADITRVLEWIPVCYLGYFIMFCIYCLIILIFTGLNPIKFVKKFLKAILTAFSTGSSAGTLPTSLECCDNMGIDKKIYAFSIPYGSTINMDGSCILMTISAFFMAKIFSVPITSTFIVTLIMAVLVLSIGAPGVPGAALVCMAILFPLLGIPVEAISIIMGIYTICSRGLVVSNVTGDAVITLVVSKQEKMLDLSKFN